MLMFSRYNRTLPTILVKHVNMLISADRVILFVLQVFSHKVLDKLQF